MESFDREKNGRYWDLSSETYSKTIIEDIDEGLSGNWVSLMDERMPKGKLKILDCGCGPGFFSIVLGKMGHEVIGIDYSEGMLKEAEINCARHGVRGELIRMDAENLEFDDGCFDLVVTRNVLWNLPHPDKAYSEIIRVLKNGGAVCVFDASYAEFDMTSIGKDTEEERKKNPYMRHRESESVREEMKENGQGMSSLPLNSQPRPEWDISVLKRLNVKSIDIVFEDNFNFHPADEKGLKNRHFFFLWGVKE